MVHYIRFLRTPQVSDISKKGINLSCVAAVTTDLGDSFFPKSLSLIVRVVDASNAGEILFAENVVWRPDSRAIKLNLSLNSKLTSRLVFIHITTKESIAQVSQFCLPDVLDVWSAQFSLKAKHRTDPLVERRLRLSSKCCVRMLEETGDSIARHIWDASIGFCCYFKNCYKDENPYELPKVAELLRQQKTTRLKVLEVGSGCGVVGVALAQLRKCDVVLTDLEDAQGILQSNVELASPVPGSIVRHQVLGWGPNLEDLSDSNFDLVLVSDCIYNPDSSILLVETLEQVCKQNPSVLILVGFKRRHAADDIFFERMKACGFRVDEQTDIILPHTMTEYDTTEPKIEMFVFTLSSEP